MSLALNLVSLFLSVAALATSTLLLVRQTTFMRHANEIPVAVDLHQEFRSSEFQQAYLFVLDSLQPAYDSSLGLSNLPTEARVLSTRVAGFFTSLGGLVVLGLVDERYAVSLLGTAAERAWAVLEPYIAQERRTRGDEAILAFYEDFVCRTKDRYPLASAYGMKFRRLADVAREQQPLPVVPPVPDE
jgi:hypothetical protein